MQLNGCKRAFRYAKMVIKTEGLAALFRSLPITIVFSPDYTHIQMMNLPFSSLLVALNENFKIFIKPEKRSHKFAWYFACASTAGIIMDSTS